MSVHGACNNVAVYACLSVINSRKKKERKKEHIKRQIDLNNEAHSCHNRSAAQNSISDCSFTKIFSAVNNVSMAIM